MFQDAGAVDTSLYSIWLVDTGARSGSPMLGATEGAEVAGAGAATVDGEGAAAGVPAVEFEFSLPGVPAATQPGAGAEAFDCVPTAGADAAGAGTGTAAAVAGAGTATAGAGAGTPAQPQLLLNTQACGYHSTSRLSFCKSPHHDSTERHEVFYSLLQTVKTMTFEASYSGTPQERV